MNDSRNWSRGAATRTHPRTRDKAEELRRAEIGKHRTAAIPRIRAAEKIVEAAQRGEIPWETARREVCLIGHSIQPHADAVRRIEREG